MTASGQALAALGEGLSLGVQFNPLASMLASTIAAALVGFPRASDDRRWYAGLVLALGWLAGDGLRVLGHARDYLDGLWQPLAGATLPWVGWVLLAAWAFVTLGLGYVLPALIGATVGRRVTHGTGWLAAGAVAVGASAAISAIVGGLS